MTRNGSNLQPRREFLRLAAFSGAAALTGKGAAAAGEQNAGTQSADSHEGNDNMEFLRVSGRHMVNAKGKQVRLRGTCPGGWMNM
jgi:endoglucanase